MLKDHIRALKMCQILEKTKFLVDFRLRSWTKFKGCSQIRLFFLPKISLSYLEIFANHMHDSKLLTILKTLSSDEFYRFHEFVVSPFFNKNKKIILLFNFIKKYYPKFNNNNFTREKCFAHTFPDEKFNDSKLRVLMAKLLKLLEDYLVATHLSKDTCLQSISIQSIIRKKKIFKYYESYNQATKKTLEAYPYRSYEYFNYMYDYYFEYHNYAIIEDKYSGSFSLQNLADSMDLFYLNRKLSFCADMAQREYFLSTHHRKPLYSYLVRYFKKIEKISKKNLEDLHPATAILFYYNMLFTSNNEHEYYKKIIALLEKYSMIFKPSEMIYLYNLLTNYLNFKFYKGESRYIYDLFSIYKFLLTRKFFFRDNFLKFTDYHNIASTAFYLKEFKWAKEFLLSYKNKLEPKYRESLFNLESAWLNLYLKNYNIALNNLQKIELSDYNFYLDSRKILTRIYFETEENEGFFALTDSFRHYLKRNKMLSKELKKSFINYSNILQKLFRIKIGEKNNIHEVKKLIKETNLLDSKDWLREKAMELEGSK